MDRKHLLLPLLPALVGCASDKSTEKPLNIIYIMTDDHTQQAMSCYDNRYTQTPNLDRLAEQGAMFENSFVANSISGPSRACILTGKHSHLNSMPTNDRAFDSTQRTFIQILGEQGYQTSIIGKWHLGGTPVGFDHWDILPEQGWYYNPEFITKTGIKKHAGYVTNIVTDKGIEYLESRDRNRPFCMMLHHKAVHRNWFADTGDFAAFEDKTYPLPETFWDDYSGREAAAHQQMSVINDMDLRYDLKITDTTLHTRLMNWGSESTRMTPEQFAAWSAVYEPITKDFRSQKMDEKQLAEWKYQRYLRDYMKCVKSLDDNIGRLMAYLEKEGLLENTIIIYASDQGFYLGEHGWFDKRFIYEESLSTPLVVRYPNSWKNVARGTKIAQMVQNIDYAPTMLQLAGAEVPEDMQGVSMLPLLKGETPADWRKSIYYHYYEYPAAHRVHSHYGVRTSDNYKLVHFYGDGIDSWEMFDLNTDPTEMKNIYADETYADRRAVMHKELDKLKEQYKVKNP